MLKSGWAFALFGILLWSCPQLASAQATRTWISGVGDDANPCSRTAPCKTWAGAFAKTATNGEIDALDPGGFGALTITKAITIAAEGAGEGGVLVAGTNGFSVSAGASDVVVLRGLQFEGLGAGAGSPAGVQFNSGAVLIVQNCVIHDFAGTGGYGIAFTPSGASDLFVSDTLVAHNPGGGILVAPAGGTARARIARTNVVNNGFGARADGTSGAVDLVIADSVFSGNSNSGIVAQYGTVSANVTRSTISQNNVGLHAVGATTALRIGSSTVTGNVTGVAIQSGASISSYGNNQVDGNAAPGQTMSIIALK